MATTHNADAECLVGERRLNELDEHVDGHLVMLILVEHAHESLAQVRARRPMGACALQ